MSTEIKVPSLGESITQAFVASVTKKSVGDSIVSGEVICQLETDKVTMDVCSPDAGILEQLHIKTGDTINVGQLVASLSEKAGGASVEDSVAKRLDYGKKDSPAAVKMMQENQIDKSKVKNTGRDSRVTKADVVEYCDTLTKNSQEKTESFSVPAFSAVDSVQDSYRRCRRVKMSNLRRKISERLKLSQNTAAMLTTFNELDMSTVMNLRAQYRDSFQKKHGLKLGFMSFFVKAVVEALKANPDLNAEIQGNDIVYKDYYDIGVAVGTEKGLVVPVIRNAELLSMCQIEAAISYYASKAKEGKLMPSDMSGGTFTISNGGTYGSLLSTPIINPPQSGILGMHSIVQRPVAVGKDSPAIEIRPMMYIALSYDHRIVDGKGAVTFLIAIKEMLEDVNKLILGI